MLHIDEAAVAEIHEKCVCAEEVCAKNRARDISVDKTPSIRARAKSEGDILTAEHSNGSAIGSDE